ncbi:MAG TPA: tetratricopeptide repeat protein [Phycisphaerae bacterium]|nr:tetratricopeptide repeat protein [Phycisphaerae bacterium]
MSRPVGPGQLRQSLAGKWQVPLLACALVLLAVGLVRMGPDQEEVPFEMYVKRVEVLMRGRFHTQAAELIKSLLEQERPDEEVARLRRLMARTIFAVEKPLAEHDPENAKRIIYNYGQATERGLPPTAEDVEQLAAAYEWLGRWDKAVARYRQALSLAPSRPNQIRRRLIELLGIMPDVPPDRVAEEIDSLLAHSQDDPANLVWAVERKAELLLRQGQLDEARELLTRTRRGVTDGSLSGQLDYLAALTEFYAGDYDEAEPLVRQLRARLSVSDELSAKTGWLLGRLDYQQDRPQYALSVFDDVLASFASGPYVTGCMLGRAECLAALERYDEAGGAYEEVVALFHRGRHGRLVDGAAVRTSLTGLYYNLRARGRTVEALRFIKLALDLTNRQDLEKVTWYLGVVARLHEELGRQARSEADRLGGDPHEGASAERLAEAKRHFGEAANTWLELAKANTLRDAIAEDAAWQAADDFDLAGETESVIEILSEFIVQRPNSPRTPQARFRLGQAYQAQNELHSAIESYRTLVQKHPRTLSAFSAMVPLSQCFVALGADFYEQAEQVLLLVLEEDPSQPGLYTPEAPLFREALFRLGELYGHMDRHTDAIARLADFLEYYPQDARRPQVQFMLADSYLKAGLALRSRAGGDVEFNARETLLGEFRKRLQEAARLYEQVIEAYGARPEESLSAREQLYLRLGYLYRAECAFELGQYEQAVPLYEQAAYRYQNEPVSLSAYLQIINCYFRLGERQRARTALGRARWLLRRMPVSDFAQQPTGIDRQRWQDVLAWVEDSGLLASQEGSAP